MEDTIKFSENLRYVLKQYGIDALDFKIKIIDEGPDNISIIIFSANETYFIASDDYLCEDQTYENQAKEWGLSKLIPLKLLQPSQDGEYVTMFNQFQICKIYKAY